MIDLFINGKRLKSSSGETRNIIHPADGSIVEVAQESTNSDVEMAIKSARLAFETGPWSKTTNAHRSSVLKRIAELLERDKASFAKAESKDTGKKFIEAEYDMDDVIKVFKYFAELISQQTNRKVNVDRENIESTIHYEPVGVVGLITPWNYPLLQASWKIAPALAAGCTFVIKWAKFVLLEHDY
jgi:betaine-aldehyde dehydrogenase